MNHSFIKKINKYLIQLRISQIEKKKKLTSDFSNRAIGVFSNPRGGSTWLLEMIHNSGEFITVNEPLFQGKFRTDGVMPSFKEGEKYLKGLDFWYYQPLEESFSTPKHKVFFKELFSGKHLNTRLTAYSSLKQLSTYNQVIVKFCYANLMLPWISENFNIASILLLRHPCAVVSSQLKIKGAFRHIIDHPTISLPDFEGVEYFDKYSPFLNKIKRPEENLAAIWAISVKHAIDHPANNKKWLTFHYEDLFQNPQNCLDTIKTRFPDFKWNNNKIDFKNPSRATLDGNIQKHINHGTQLSKWKNELSKSQINNIMATVKDFGVDIYT